MGHFYMWGLLVIVGGNSRKIKKKDHLYVGFVFRKSVIDLLYAIYAIFHMLYMLYN